MRRAWIGLVAIFVGCAGCDERRGEAPPSAARPLRVVSYNVHAENKSFDETAGVIRETDADIVCLQELSGAMAAHLQAALGDTYPHRMCRDAVNGYGGLGFLSRFALHEIAYLPPEGGGWFPAWIVRVAAPGGDVQVLNVHLLPPSGQLTVEALRAAATAPVHVREIEAYVARLNPAAAAMVVGDFNEPDDGPAVERLLERGFVNVLPVLAPGAMTCRGRVLGVRFGTGSIMCYSHLTSARRRPAYWRPGPRITIRSLWSWKGPTKATSSRCLARDSRGGSLIPCLLSRYA